MTQQKPNIHTSTYVDESAAIIGNVTIGKNCGIYPQAVIRGDENTITIKDETNIQDCCIIHVDETHPVYIGNKVSLGHGCIVHGATIEDSCIIGMHATVLNGAIVKKGSIIGAHALVTSNMVIPEKSLVLGTPGQVKKQDGTYEIQADKNAEIYVHLSKQYKEKKYPRYTPYSSKDTKPVVHHFSFSLSFSLV